MNRIGKGNVNVAKCILIFMITLVILVTILNYVKNVNFLILITSTAANPIFESLKGLIYHPLLPINSPFQNCWIQLINQSITNLTNKQIYLFHYKLFIIKIILFILLKLIPLYFIVF